MPTKRKPKRSATKRSAHKPLALLKARMLRLERLIEKRERAGEK